MQAGFGVMVSNMFGDNGAEHFNKAIGKTIKALAITNNALRIDFDDGYAIALRDEGQSCCETRYINTDDDLPYYVGAKLVSGEVAPAPSPEHEWGVHQVSFLRITTDRGVFTVQTHNEHNGYYGGFAIVVRLAN